MPHKEILVKKYWVKKSFESNKIFCPKKIGSKIYFVYKILGLVKGPFTDGSTRQFWLPIFPFYPIWSNFLILWSKWVLLWYARVTGHVTPCNLLNKAKKDHFRLKLAWTTMGVKNVSGSPIFAKNGHFWSEIGLWGFVTCYSSISK